MLPSTTHPPRLGPHRATSLPVLRLPGSRAIGSRSQAGFHLLDLLVTLVILGLVATLAAPPLFRASAGLRVRLAAAEVAGVMRRARSTAVMRSTRVAVKFGTEGERVTYTLYRDGDGDGVRSRDIERGVDPPMTRPQPLMHVGKEVRFGFPPGPPPKKPSGSGRLSRLHDPIRFNRSDLASFDPVGTSTPGSVYLTDGRDRLAVVRLFHRTGKVKILVYDRKTESWR